MIEHKGLTISSMLWWIRKETDVLKLESFGDDDEFTLTIIHSGEQKTFTGSMPNVIAAAYDFISDDTEQYHHRVRDFFSTVTGGLVDNTLQHMAQEKLAEEEST